MLKRNARATMKLPFRLAATLSIMALWGCNQPSVPTPPGKIILEAELTNLLEDEVSQNLDLTNVQQTEKTVSICPEDLAEITVVTDSVEDKQTKALYLTNVTMIVTQNGGFEITAGEQGNPINVGTETAGIMAVPYLVSCSKVNYLNALTGQTWVDVSANE